MTTRPADSAPLVLLVEDDQDSREMYVLALEMAGFSIAEAGTAAAARDTAFRLQPHVIVTDLSLPDGDGCDLCRELTLDERTREVPVIALTGHSGDEDAVRCMAAGCVRVLVKPCPPDVLAESISEALASSPRRA